MTATPQRPGPAPRRAGSSFSLNLTADYARDRNKGPSNRALFDSGDGGLSGLYELNPDRDFNNATFDGRQDRDTWGVRGRPNGTCPSPA